MITYWAWIHGYGNLYISRPQQTFPEFMVTLRPNCPAYRWAVGQEQFVAALFCTDAKPETELDPRDGELAINLCIARYGRLTYEGENNGST